MANFGDIRTDIVIPAGQSVRRNAQDTDFEGYSPGGGGPHTHPESDVINLPTDLAGKAPSAEGVTNGNSHDHSGGDGAPIDHVNPPNVTAPQHHTNANDPTSDQKAALAGTNGTPSIANKYLTETDPRNTNARTPTSHGNSLHTSTFVTQAEIDSSINTHKAITVSVHNADASGNSPAQSHDNTRHAVAFALNSDLTAHTGAAAPHSGHVQIGGQLGGTAASPDVRGIRETGGPTLLTIGAIVDGEFLKRSGSNIISSASAGGGLTHSQVMSRVFLGV